MRKALLSIACTSALLGCDQDIALRCGPYPQPRTVVQCINIYLLKIGEHNRQIEHMLVHKPMVRQGFYGWRVTFNLNNEKQQREILINRMEGISFQFINH